MGVLELGYIVAACHLAAPEAQLIDVQKIWDKAPHNAFTDLVRHNETWFCVFREGQNHVSDDGSLRVLRSKDGETWTSAALISSDNADLRDAKICVTPRGKLMLAGAGALHQPAEAKHHSMVWFSDDGTTWSDPVVVAEKDMWLWRVTWHKDSCFGVAYATDGSETTRLYRSEDGKHFAPLVSELFSKAQNGKGYPNETSLIFRKDDSCLCLLRRDGDTQTAQLGTAVPPYTKWTWQDLGIYVGGPHMLQLPDGRIVATGRSIANGGARTVLHWLDPAAGTLTEFLALPSGGDCSYPGLAWHDGMLWVSYYSSHEGKTSIYLARVKVD